MPYTGYFINASTVASGECLLRQSGPGLPGWKHYRDPAKIRIANGLHEVQNVLEEIDEEVLRGLHVVACIAYGAAPAFDLALHAIEGDAPLVWAAFYAAPPDFYRELEPVGSVGARLGSTTWDLEEYAQRFERVRHLLEEGSTYQVNLTFDQPFQIDGDPAAWFSTQCGVDPPPYAALIHLGERVLASYSPELHFELKGGDIRTRPMKGTLSTPPDREGLVKASEYLRSDPKTKSENLMIVDMARNDLGAVCHAGSIRTTELMEVEKHRALLQVVSQVEGKTDRPLSKILQAVFPAASVTGAPKPATTRFIAELEGRPRGFYCGTLVAAEPGRTVASVLIRTGDIRLSDGAGRFGIGSGVVWESDAVAEFAECRQKIDRLSTAGTEWKIRDAIAVHRVSEPGHIERHLDRLQSNAKAFGVPFDRTEIRRQIVERSTAPANGIEKVRVVIDRKGAVETSRLPSVVEAGSMRIALARQPLCSQDPNLRYKTTSRAMLDDGRDRCPEADDVLFYNENGFVTEFGYANVVVERNGAWLTPFVEDGCLEGLGVLELIAAGKVRREHIPLDWLIGSTVYYVNSVAGLTPVQWLEGEPRKTPNFSHSTS